MSELLALGASHKTAGVAVRERIALTDAGAERFMRELVGEAEIQEAVVLSTCNRTEIYLVVGDPVEAETAVLGRLARRAGVRPTELLEGIYSLRNCDAAAAPWSGQRTGRSTARAPCSRRPPGPM